MQYAKIYTGPANEDMSVSELKHFTRYVILFKPESVLVVGRSSPAHVIRYIPSGTVYVLLYAIKK